MKLSSLWAAVRQFHHLMVAAESSDQDSGFNSSVEVIPLETEMLVRKVNNRRA